MSVPQDILDALNTAQTAKDNRTAAQGDLDAKVLVLSQAQNDANVAQTTLNTAVTVQAQALADLKARLDAYYGG